MIKTILQMVAGRGVPDMNSMNQPAVAGRVSSRSARAATMCGLTPFLRDRERGVLTVRKGKGGKDRVVPVGERAVY